MPFQFVKFLRHLSGSFSFVQPDEVSYHRHKSQVHPQSSVFILFYYPKFLFINLCNLTSCEGK